MKNFDFYHSKENYHGDDRYVIRKLDDEKYLFAVLDGATLHKGHIASSYGKEFLENISINSSDDLEDKIIQLNKKIIKNCNESKSTLSLVYLDGTQVHTYSAGDSPIYLIQDKNIQLINQLHNISNNSSNIYSYLGKEDNKFKLSKSSIQIQKGDKIIVSSDGIPNNFSCNELKYLINSNYNSSQFISSLSKKIKFKIEEHKKKINFFKGDDLTLISIYF